MLNPKCVQKVYHLAAYKSPFFEYIRIELLQVPSQVFRSYTCELILSLPSNCAQEYDKFCSLDSPIGKNPL